MFPCGLICSPWKVDRPDHSNSKQLGFEMLTSKVIKDVWKTGQRGGPMQQLAKRLRWYWNLSDGTENTTLGFVNRCLQDILEQLDAIQQAQPTESS
ncbi:hypothetical protein NL676_021456 [Syzygium grande]|nr:hypothetical protein NL676_021456 [Syzygium grande]